jgi:hypothetical protein
MNLKSIFYFAAIFAILSLLMSCNRKGGSNSITFPFVKTGNEWMYGMYNKDNELSSDTLKFIIVSEENECCFKTNFHDFYDSYWYADGELWKTHTNESGQDGFIALHKDTYVGQKWEIMDSTYIMEVLSGSETVIVPAGVFENCIKVAMTYKETGDLYQNWLFSKEFGVIKRELTGGRSMQLISKNF